MNYFSNNLINSMTPEGSKMNRNIILYIEHNPEGVEYESTSIDPFISSID